MSQPYKHVPLKASYSIRVLCLKPALDHDAPLVCTLVERLLDPAPEYSALSYAWDAQSPSCSVECGGGVLSVTQNCEFALRRLRSEKEVRSLWIDSICIDQTSRMERSQQVALMGDIYKCAKQVIVWLGEGDGKTEVALERLSDIAQVGGGEKSEDTRAAFQLIFGVDVHDPSEDPIGPVFERSWFYRMWTVQEATLPHIENVVVYCGSTSIAWIHLLIAINYLRISKYRWGRWAEATQLQKQISGLLMDIRNPGFRAIFDNEPSNTNAGQNTLQILVSARKKKASEPKDKIFALFGVLKELGLHLPMPDYQNSLEQIYTEAAIACINHGKSLDILFEAPSDNRRAGLPSWVPDWSDAGWNSSDPRKAMFGSTFRVAEPADPPWRISPDQKKLIISGRIMDSIQARGAALELEGDLDIDFLSIGGGKVKTGQFLRKIHPAFDVMKGWVGISSQHAKYPTGETVGTALRCTLLDGDVTQTSQSPSESSFDSWYGIMKSSCKDVLTAQVEKANPTQSEITSTPSISGLSQAQTLQFPEEMQSFLALTTSAASGYHFAAVRHGLRKCFFLTAKGYFGIAASLVQQGDKIVALAGMKTPVVLRGIGRAYCFVAPAYVHGIMDNEVRSTNIEEIIVE
jgi:hypothetical protein